MDNFQLPYVMVATFHGAYFDADVSIHAVLTFHRNQEGLRFVLVLFLLGGLKVAFDHACSFKRALFQAEKEAGALGGVFLRVVHN